MHELCLLFYTADTNSSAAAWIVEVGVLEGGQWKYRPLAFGGTYFETPLSSFTVEAIALDECTLFIKRLLDKYSVRRPLGKRMRIE